MPKASKHSVAPATDKAVILLRVSTQQQADSGLGLEAQEAACRALCAHKGWPVVAVHSDPGISGKDSLAKRPGLRAAIADVQANEGAALVVYSLSRLARSQRLIWTLIDTAGDVRLPLVSATEPFETKTAMGRAMLGMLGVWAQLEADLVSERTVAALEAARARGTRLGTPSMLERVDAKGSRVFDARKVSLVREVQDLYAREDLSHRDLAEELNARGVASVNGRRWHAKTVRAALRIELPADDCAAE